VFKYGLIMPDRKTSRERIKLMPVERFGMLMTSEKLIRLTGMVS
jgi:hypothetical protein